MLSLTDLREEYKNILVQAYNDCMLEKSDYVNHSPINSNNLDIVTAGSRPLKYVKNFLDSLQNQTIQPNRVIFVDYGGGKQLKRLCKKYPFVDYEFIKTDLPWWRSLYVNYGIRKARAKYVMVADMDSVYEPNFIETILKYLENNSFLMCFYYETRQNFWNKEVDIKDWDTIRKLSYAQCSYGTGSCQIASRKWLNKVRGYDERIFGHKEEDWDLTFRALRDKLKLNWIDRICKGEKGTSLIHQYHERLNTESKFVDLCCNFHQLDSQRDRVIRNTRSWGRVYSRTKKRDLKCLQKDREKMKNTIIKTGYETNGSSRINEFLTSKFVNYSPQKVLNFEDVTVISVLEKDCGLDFLKSHYEDLVYLNGAENIIFLVNGGVNSNLVNLAKLYSRNYPKKVSNNLLIKPISLSEMVKFGISNSKTRLVLITRAPLRIPRIRLKNQLMGMDNNIDIVYSDKALTVSTTNEKVIKTAPICFENCLVRKGIPIPKDESEFSDNFIKENKLTIKELNTVACEEEIEVLPYIPSIKSFRSKGIDVVTTNPLVSIVMAIYNEEKFISEAIESVLEQSYDNFELIIVDDGSTDNTVSIIKTKFHDDRIKLFRREHLGFAYAKNFGISQMKSEFYCQADGDDIVEKGRIIYSLQAFAENPQIGVVFGDVETFTPEGHRERWRLGEFNINKQLGISRCLVPGGASMVRRNVLNNVSGFDPEFDRSSDFEWILRAYSKGTIFKHVPELFIQYRIGGNRNRLSGNVASLKQHSELRDYWRKKLKK